MKTLKLTGSNLPSLSEVLAMAHEESLILRTASGEEYFVGIVDEFQHEIDQLNASAEFQQLLRDRAKERGTIPIEDTGRQKKSMPDPHFERALLTIAKLTSPEILEANLIRASFFLTAYELFEFSVVDQLRRAYLDYRLSMTLQEREASYQKEVRQLDRHAFGASLKWYEKEGILSAAEVAKAQELRELRNKVAHRLPQLLTEPEDTIGSLDGELLEALTLRLDRWFVKTYEIPTIEELDGREIPDAEIMSGNMAVLFLMRETLSKKASAAGVAAHT